MRDALMQRFRPVFSEAAMRSFTIFVEHATAIEERDGDVVLRFPDDERARDLCIRPAAAPSKPWPPHPALADFLGVSAELCFGELGGVSQLVLSDGYSGTLHLIGEDILPSEISYAPSLCAPIDIGHQAYYLFPPDGGERLWFIDEGPVEVADSGEPIEIYFRELAYKLRTVNLDTPFQRALGDAPHRSTWLVELA